MCLTSPPVVAPADRASLTLDRRWYSGTITTPLAPSFCAGAYPLEEDGKGPTYSRGGLAKCAKGMQSAHFSERQKLTHSPTLFEKHAGQETPLHYTH